MRVTSNKPSVASMPLETSRIIDELLGIMIYVFQAGLVASKTVSACGVGTVDLGYDHGRLEYGRW
ncbi:hypothetical protein M422DRAFT_253296 [Sphaerobolus stellatus SS14]|uniref:Uncharacterized protein n=1 Tax=Sphaerobolus stellatus (strain SS14) TaxID=990650 RepID=A0A0C9VX73_SPHS4|nr:hypothetical protein M422DRAFT_253296 [Sphaerobolus stellatus SS14]